MHEAPSGGVRLVAEQIDELGAEHCIIATDFGVYTLPTPVEGFRSFIACMLDLGIPVDAIRKPGQDQPGAAPRARSRAHGAATA
jgi:hypothetical protein